MNEIFWPEDYIPGFTENFASNEVIVAGLSAVDVWPLLGKAPLWPTYYSNSANIRFYDGKGPELEDGVRFYFETFGFPVEAQVLEYVPPAEGKPGRLGWRCRSRPPRAAHQPYDIRALDRWLDGKAKLNNGADNVNRTARSYLCRSFPSTDNLLNGETAKNLIPTFSPCSASRPIASRNDRGRWQANGAGIISHSSRFVLHA